MSAWSAMMTSLKLYAFYCVLLFYILLFLYFCIYKHSFIAKPHHCVYSLLPPIKYSITQRTNMNYPDVTLKSIKSHYHHVVCLSTCDVFFFFFFWCYYYFSILFTAHLYWLCLLHCYFTTFLHCVSKNDTDVAHYNLNAYWRILVIFGRDVASEWWFVISVLLTNVSALPVETWNHKLGSFQLCCIPKKTLLWLAISSTFINQF